MNLHHGSVPGIVSAESGVSGQGGKPVMVAIRSIVLFFGGDFLGSLVGNRVNTVGSDIVSLLGHQSGCSIMRSNENVSVG